MEQETIDAMEYSLEELLSEVTEGREYCEIAVITIDVDGKPCQVTVKLIINPDAFLIENQIYYLDSQPNE